MRNRFWMGMVSLALLAPSGVWAQEKESQNEGGKWMPSQILELQDELKALGLEVDPKLLSDPSSHLLKAIVSLGGCSGSFISKEGLIVTNHHCVEKILSYLTAVDHQKGIESDFVKTGFLAKDRSEERSAGPTQKIFITTRIADVTERVRAGFDRMEKPEERYQALESRQKEIVRESESASPYVKSEVKSFFRGEKFFLIERLQLDDIRIVYAPPADVGYYGGDEHNWHWPRFVGDFALLRAYVGGDGKPAAFSAENRPYVPEQTLKVSRAGLKADDLVLVAGFPGSTERLDSGIEFKESIEKNLPRMVGIYGDYLDFLESLSNRNDDWRKKTESTRFSFSNFVKNRKQGFAAVERMDVVSKRLKEDEALKAWIDADPARKAKYADVFAQLEALQKKVRTSDVELATNVLFAFSEPAKLAFQIVKKAFEATKPDAERRPSYQERMWKDLWAAQVQAQATLEVPLEIEKFSFLFDRLANLVTTQDHEAAQKVFARVASGGKPLMMQRGYRFEPSAFKPEISELLKGSRIFDLAFREELFRSSWEELQKNEDPMIRLALEYLPSVSKLEARAGKEAGEALMIAPKYVQAMREFRASQGKGLAPDANSTLRITYGKVKGYTKPSDGKFYAPFTNLSQLVNDQHTPGKKHFEVPESVLRAYEKNRHDPLFADSTYGEIPIDFLANVDTTGGNSGSAVLNKRGELAGLLFDGDEEAGYRDWLFDDNVRSIQVDARYFLWTLANVADARHLLEEMDITPSCSDSLTEKPKL